MYATGFNFHASDIAETMNFVWELSVFISISYGIMNRSRD